MPRPAPPVRPTCEHAVREGVTYRELQERRKIITERLQKHDRKSSKKR